ncbi:DNA polymerase III subunit chi [Notoacmeibacter sp. MSK16QG-6]|uniref:DNA polymerase III subunit chi n=1 Tax=Notoacmeibacter sp. MSK16QG-6 TaxID=2957982 RepID=UPI00209F2C93|nr:DNA polymerase III subunit chi [Notoacmeibacter sp. MSK16QG-6]MCP1197974.1 DNA polymerase III subunit chi [Notoacmeibacter sp. MSK16QG-6]
MAEIWFYHLTDSTLHAALPTLLEKSLARGWRAAVEVPDERLRDALDTHLWTFQDGSFLAHGVDVAKNMEPADQPILLTVGGGNANGAQVRFLGGGAMPGDGIEAYKRVVLMFDGHDEAQLADARAAWKSLKAEGHDVTYWQQGEGGGWRKMA